MVKDVIELHPGTADQNLTKILQCSDLDWTWWKMIKFHPGTAEPEYDLQIFQDQI